METSRKKIIFRNVGPAILSNACVFLFSVVDGIFVGNGARSQALGAVNLALPFVLLAQTYGAKEDDELKQYYRAGQLISVAVYVIFPHFIDYYDVAENFWKCSFLVK